MSERKHCLLNTLRILRLNLNGRSFTGVIDKLTQFADDNSDIDDLSEDLQDFDGIDHPIVHDVVDLIGNFRSDVKIDLD